jgi:hypothetical protein
LVLYYWHFKKDGTVLSTIGRAPDKYQPYENEPQGEAFCFANDAKSYFTLSEVGQSDVRVSLYQYFRVKK